MLTIRTFIILIFILFLTSCGSKSNTSAATAIASASTPFTSAIESISNGVSAAGGGLQTSSFTLTENQELAETESFLTVTPMVAGLCNSHGSPIEIDTSNISQSDVRFPFIFTYCAMTINDGDTVRGGFDLVKGLICSLETAGVTFTGVAQTLTIDFNNTTCWPTGGPGGMTGTGTLTATGTSPATFNTHFEKGVEFIFNTGSDVLTYKVAANISSSSIEFIAHESWDSGNTGVMAGTIDKTTGVLKYEKRDERIYAGCVSGSCGWNRHSRILANLTLTSGEPSGLTSLSYAYSDTHVADLTDAGATTSSGKLITAIGSLTGGIKARIFIPSGSSTVAQIKDHSTWTETIHTGCMTGTVGINDSADCTSNNGIAKFVTSTKFALVSSSTHLSPAAWLAAYSGFTFTTIDTDIDQAF